MNIKEKIILLVVFLILILLGLYTTHALVQKSFILELDTLEFLYEQNQFNDSSFSKEYDFPSPGNITYWVTLPKNSTILNVTFNLTGKITTIYKVQISSYALKGLSIGNATPNEENEISIGIATPAGEVKLLYGINGSKIWNISISPNQDIYSTSIGNLTPDLGEEIAIASQNNYVYLLASNGTEIWNKSLGSPVYTVRIGDVYGNQENYLVAGAGSNVFVINSSGDTNWSMNLGETVYSISIGNFTSDPGNEIITGCGSGKIFVLNSTGSIVNNFTLGSSSINSVDVGNLTSDPGNEIIAGSADSKVYVINSSGDIVWEFSTGGSVNSVRIGDTISQEEGNEVVVGSNDMYVYTLNKDGELIWNFKTEHYVNTIDIGNLTSDEGNEIAAGGANGYLYTFNFDYFPENVSIDVGEDGSYEWKSSGKLRTTIQAGGNSELINAFQSFLDSCSPNTQGICDVPLLFHSDWPGKLNISGINITYKYNASGSVFSQTVYVWSRTKNIHVNESVGNQSINITFSYPSVPIQIHYIRVNDSATVCDFNGSRYSVTIVNGKKVCDVPDFNIPVSGLLPGPFLFWDDTMPTGKPVLMNESAVWYTYGIDNYFWRKNLTIWNTSSQTIWNVIASTTLNDTEIHGEEYLKVKWNETWCELTPDTQTSTCNTSNPSYESKTCGSDIFYVCKQDTNSNGVIDFFQWVQPHTSYTVYETGGATNIPPNLSEAGVLPNSSEWGEWFNFTVHVNDFENDCVNVSLWIYHPLTGWRLEATQNTTGNATLWFNLSSDMNWTGDNEYNFSYFDYNCSNTSEIYHSISYTSLYLGPQVHKHNVSILHIQGNNSEVNRSESVTLIVRINDTTTGTWVGEGVNCRFWITKNGVEFDSGYANKTNASGYCMYTFIPDGNYTPGNQTWIAGVYNDTYYSDTNSSEMSLTIKGKINIHLFSPLSNQTLYRNNSNTLLARIMDEYGLPVNISGYNCSFWFEGNEIGNTTTNSTGWCIYYWNPNCTASLGESILNVTLSGNVSPFYFLNFTETHNPVIIKDYLVVSIQSPSPSSLHHKTDTLYLNSTVNDSCLICEAPYTTDWYLQWKGVLRIDIEETYGVNRTNEPVILNATTLKEYADLSQWQINYTKARINGKDIPVEIKTWTNETKTEINDSQSYMNDYSELVFLVNLTAYQNLTVWIYYNDSNITNYDLKYLENAGFESGNLEPWYCSGINCIQGPTNYCECGIKKEGTEPTGNFSAYLSAKETPNDIVSSLRYNLSSGTLTSYLKIVYKTGGDFSGDSYLRLRAGNGICELNTSQNVWHTQICTNFSFSNATDLEISLHDEGEAGASYVYIDYICIADSNGTCINFMTGAPLQKTLTSFTKIASGDNQTWVIPENETLGLRHIFANASGEYYRHASQNVSIWLYGWSNVNWSNISSSYCVYNQTFNCSKNATIDILCKIIDANSSKGISNYNVSFYGDDKYLGSNLTDINGLAVYTWTNSTDIEGTHNVSCKIMDDAKVFYNSSYPSNSTTEFIIASGNTTCEIQLTPTNLTTSDNITRTNNYTFSLTITLINKGLSPVYNPQINITVPSGITAQPVSCPSLQINENCTVVSKINITSYAPLGNQTINVTTTWTNADGTQDNTSNTTWIFVLNNTVLKINETSLTYYIPIGGTKYIGNFTIQAFGNTDLKNIEFSWSGDNATELSSWTTLTPSTISLISKNQDQSVSVNISVPSNASQGIYTAYILANATGSFCEPSNECEDSVLLNITVTQEDWSRIPEILNKTIGIGSGNGSFSPIIITNHLNTSITFNLSLSGNGTTYINLPYTQFTLENQSSQRIYIHHNTSTTYSPGTYTVNLTIFSLNDTVPKSLNTTITLNIVELTIDILSPNSSNPTSPVNVSDLINITVNATYNYQPINDTDPEHPLSWSVKIGNKECISLNATYNASTSLWLLECEAPEIEGNPIHNDLFVNGTITGGPLKGVFCIDEEENAITYVDYTPPQIWNITANSVNYFDNILYISITANITDNTNVSNVWLKITLPNGSSQYLYTFTLSASIYTFNYTNPNLLGEYILTVYTNDTLNHTNSTSSWFEVYKPVQFEFNNTYVSEDADMEFIFYRPGTSEIIHSFHVTDASKTYNWSIRKRVYDLKISVYNHTLKFYNLNISQAVISQWSEDGENLTNPIRFKNIPYQNIGILDLPVTSKNKLLGFVIHNSYLTSFAYLNLLLNYSYEYPNLNPSNLNEQRFRIYVCESWNFNSSLCTGSWERKDESVPDIQTHTISVNLTTTSAFAVAEYCPECGTSQQQPTGGTGATGGGGGGGGGGTEETIGFTAVCGNGKCEIGENEINCPEDCAEEFPFSVKTLIGDIRMYPGENATYPFYIKNKINKTITVNIGVEGEIKEFFKLSKNIIEIPPNETKTITISVLIPKTTQIGTYTGIVSVTSGSKRLDIPVTLKVSLEGTGMLSLDVSVITQYLVPGDKLKIAVEMRNIGSKPRLNVTLTYLIKDSKLEKIIWKGNETYELEDILTFTKIIQLNKNIKPATYIIETIAEFDNRMVKKINRFYVVVSFWDTPAGRILPWAVLLAVSLITFFFIRKKYFEWKLSKMRYLFPEFDKLPQKTDNAFWIGKIAETNRDAWLNPKDLTTHIIIAGATGSGKSVGASVIVEEALERNIPVIVFDPTAQWTGFVKPCIDENLLRYYPMFNMKPLDAKPYKGLILEITDPNIKIDFKKYINPGEITVFTLNKLKPGEYDIAVRNIIDLLFQMPWEESTELKLLLVFDEVHRLLEKYGGKGGYVALEKACREFRKWGIGLIMCSQVLADFKEAIAGNVLIDVQMNTKSIVDIKKVESKYGPEYARRVTRQGIGVGMFHCPKYNNGKPYFVQFRPTYHNPHKITNEEMETYKKFAARLDIIEKRINEMKNKGKDVFDLELEFKLAREKLKLGRFRMAQIYITSLEQHLNIKGK